MAAKPGTAGAARPAAGGRAVSARLGLLDLGHRAYGETLELQRALCRRRMAGELDRDLLLLVEHEPVITLGRATRPASLPLAPGELERRGVGVVEVERGGDVTYHGPGQLVGYPILQLREHREDLHWYLRQLEAALITALAELGIGEDADRVAGLERQVRPWVRDHLVPPHDCQDGRPGLAPYAEVPNSVAEKATPGRTLALVFPGDLSLGQPYPLYFDRLRSLPQPRERSVATFLCLLLP